MNSSLKTSDDFFKLILKYRTAIMGIAALWIFIFHNRFFFPLSTNVNYIVIFSFFKNIGFCGVDIFLFLTGIGLYSSITQHSLKQYYINRLRRIGITYLLSTIIISIMMNWTLKTFVSVFSLWSSFSVSIYLSLWFYTLIILVYACFPAYYYLFSRFSNKLIFSILMLILWLCIGIAVKPIMRIDLWGIYNRLPVIIIGIYIGYWSTSHSFRVTPLSIVSLIAALSIGIYLEVITTLFGRELLIPASNSHFPSAILSISLCFLLAWFFNLLSTLKYLKPVVSAAGFVGTMSLEFYSVQEIIMAKTNAFFIYNVPGYLRSLLTFLLVLISAYILYLCKKTILKLIDGFNTKH